MRFSRLLLAALLGFMPCCAPSSAAVPESPQPPQARAAASQNRPALPAAKPAPARSWKDFLRISKKRHARGNDPWSDHCTRAYVAVCELDCGEDPHTCDLLLDGVTSLTPAELKIILQHGDVEALALDDLRHLEPAGFALLAGQDLWLSLGGLRGLEAESARHFARSQEQVEEKRRGRAMLLLDGLGTLDAAAARHLASWPEQDGSLSLRGLKTLLPAVARELAATKASILFLDGLTTLDPETARELARWGGEELFLRGVRTLTPEAARELAAWKGIALYLDGLTTLSPEVAKLLARRHRGSGAGAEPWEVEIHLSLNGLHELGPAAAAALAAWDVGPKPGSKPFPKSCRELGNVTTASLLSLAGLRVLSAETARALVRWNGETLVLPKSLRVDPAMARILATWPGEDLCFGALCSSSDNPEYSGYEEYRDHMDPEVRRILHRESVSCPGNSTIE